MFRLPLFLDPNAQPGVAAPPPPIEPAPGTAGIHAIHEMVQGLREQNRAGDLMFESERDDAAVEEIEEGLEPAAEGEGTESTEETEEGAEGAEAEEPAEGEEPAPEKTTEAGEPELKKLKVPGRNPEDAEYEILADPETYERLQQAIRGGLRRDEFNRRISTVEAREEELAFVDFHLERDPANFLAERVPEAQQEAVVLRLLAQPGLLEKVLDKVAPWQENATERDKARLQMENDALKGRDRLDEDFENKKMARQAARVLSDTLDTISLGLPEDRAADFVDDCLRDVQAYYRTTQRGEALKPAEIVQVVNRRIALYGLTPEKATALLAGSTSPVPKAKPNKAAAERLSEEHKNTNRRLVRASNGRRAAAAAAPAGAAPAARPAAPPKGQGLKDRFAWMRTNLLGKKS